MRVPVDVAVPQELWQASGGVFNVDDVLQVMLYGLEEELEMRLQGRPVPSPEATWSGAADGTAGQQGSTGGGDTDAYSRATGDGGRGVPPNPKRSPPRRKGDDG